MRILVVEDNPQGLDVLETVLSMGGFDVDAHSDPSTALEAVKQPDNHFDLVITDYDMPGMNGVELLTAIDEVVPNLPKLIISGSILQSDVPERFAFLPKPFRLRKLLTIVKEYQQS